MSCATLAAAISGAALPFNPNYTEAEFEAYFQEIEISSVLTKEGCSPAAENAARKFGRPVFYIDSLFDSSMPAQNEILPPPNPDDIAMVLLTSGSTGKAKRVPLSHKNICRSALDVCKSMSLEPGDRCLSMWELFHVGGLVDLLMAPLLSGGTVITTPGFETKLFFDLLVQAKPTWYQAVPTTLGEITFHAQYHGIKKYPTDLRLIRSVAAALPPSLKDKIERIFSVPVIQTFGMTEAGPLITSTQLNGKQKKGSVGVSCGTEVAIFSPDWSILQPSVEGEVAIRGENVFFGYEEDPEANAEAFRDGWFRTGDIGRLDSDGNLFLTGRLKELINRGGEKINMQEVDDAIQSIEGIHQAACFAIPHPTLGEDIAAAIVSMPEANFSIETVRKELHEQLSGFKIPRKIIIMDELPRNAVGKINRKVLRDQAMQRLATKNIDKVENLNGVETKIADVWSRILNISDIGPEDDFISLGGDSLAGLRMVLIVEDEFGKKLPTDCLTRLTSVRAFAKVVTDSSQKNNELESKGYLQDEDYRKILTVIAMGKIPASKEGSLLKVINENGKRTPIIWFFNSPATEMLALAEYLPDDQPLYGGFSGGRIFERDDESLMPIAKSYVDEIKRIFPSGDIIVGGNCQGGRMGWMVVKLLLETGVNVLRLCFLEFSHPELVDFDNDMLLVFGRQSQRMNYQFIRWGKTGWEKPFKVKPVVSWVDGTHGGFFRADTIGSFVKTMMAFLDDRPSIEGTLDFPLSRKILLIHKFWPAFVLYRYSYKFRARLRYGKRVSFNPFSGEAINKG